MPRFEEIVPSIYDAAQDEGLWAAVLTSIADHVGALGGMLVKHAASPIDDRMVVGRLDPALTDVYLAQHRDNPWTRAIVRVRPEGATLASSFCDPAVVRRSALHADILAPQRIVDMAVAIYTPWNRRPGESGGVSFCLDARSAGDAEQVRRRFARVVPHLMRALDLGAALAAKEAASASMGGIIDAMPDAVFAIDAGGAILRTNPAGEAMLRARDGISAAREAGALMRLAAADVDEDRRLARLIARSWTTLTAQGESAGGRLRVTRPSGRTPFLVLVTPLPRARGLHAADDGPAVLVIVNDPEMPARVDDLRTAFALTAAEARVAALISTGMGVPEVARRLGVSRETARSHLARCFDKTGARSQAALVRLAATLPRR